METESLLKELMAIVKCQNYQAEIIPLKLGRERFSYNTIPVMLINNSNGQCYNGVGVFKDKVGGNFKCFETPIFRITKVKSKRGLVLLELCQLQTKMGTAPLNKELTGVCKLMSEGVISQLIRTGIMLEIKIDAISGFECLAPMWLKKGLPVANTTNNHEHDGVEVLEYITCSDGVKKVYVNQDGLPGFNVIPSPSLYTYANLFINGMLQPGSYYQWKQGQLSLKTEDAPLAGAYVILQLIKIN